MFGWLNIYAAVYDPEVNSSIIDLHLNSGKQLYWIGISFILIFLIFILDYKFYEAFSYGIYALVILSLIGVLIFGKEVAGSKSWFEIGIIRIQPSEFAKFATSLAVAKYLSQFNVRLDNFQDILKTLVIIAIPAFAILLQNDTGSFLVFSILSIVLYREGLNPTPLVLGLIAVAIFVISLVFEPLHILIAVTLLAVVTFFFIEKKLRNILMIIGVVGIVMGVVSSVNYFVDNVLQPHQQDRIKALINPDADPLGFGWNVTQSKIAIGSGGVVGKGYLKGTQTKFDFVPEQSTDFIFCTIGEEHGFLGSVVLIGLFIALFLRLIYLAERQKLKFARIYGYAVVSFMFFHFMINIGMTIGLFPVIGIPLPFFSYGGSSLMSFTLLLFVFLKLDAHKMEIL